MAPLADGDRLLYELGILVTRARRLLWTTAARNLEASGFSMVPWVLLTSLVRHGPATQRELADWAGQHPAGVSRLVDELVEQGLVRRRRDQKDRRRVRVETTRAGLTVFQTARPIVIGALREALTPLTPAERRALRATLLKLCPDGASSLLDKCETSSPKRSKR